MKEIESLPEYFVCKLDINHNIKFKDGTLLLGANMFFNTNENEQYILWSILNNFHNKNIRAHYDNFISIYKEWTLYGKRSDAFFKTFYHLLYRYSKHDNALEKHIKILQQLQSDTKRETR